MNHLELTPEQFVKPVNDYFRLATASPEVSIADVATNVDSLLQAYEAATAEQAELLVTPELSITGYSTADLFHNQHVLEQTTQGLAILANETVHGPAMLVGAPLRHNGRLYNCAVMLAAGKIAGVIPKTHLANYKEFYEMRWFSSGDGVTDQTMQIGESSVPFGTNLLFRVNGTTIGAEICEDMFAANAPGTTAALSGAQLVANLSASNELIGKREYRHTLVAGFTGRLICGYAYTSAGQGESVADVIYGGNQIVGENGRIAAERKPFASDTTPLVYDFDTSYLDHDRFVNQTWAREAGQTQTELPYRTIDITVPQPTDDRLLRFVDPKPYVPSNPETRDERCEEIFTYLAHALAQRTRDSGARSMVLGLSGGLDSTLALLTATYACDLLGHPYDFIHTVTMPATASSERTQDNATELATALGTTHTIVSINNLATDLLAAIGHDDTTEDLTFENTHARMRTNILMNYANLHRGFVVGTGDMSEIAKGWSTFNGDHMSMFNPNCNVPKTLVSHLVRWYASKRADDTTAARLLDILDTPISPELTGNGTLSQSTESLIGPYDLSDFFMNEHLRHGSRPHKIGYLALRAFQGQYDSTEVATWLDTFLAMHTRSQWKRNVAADGTKIGSTAQSPRGDLRMAPNTGRNWYKELVA